MEIFIFIFIFVIKITKLDKNKQNSIKQNSLSLLRLDFEAFIHQKNNQNMKNLNNKYNIHINRMKKKYLLQNKQHHYKAKLYFNDVHIILYFCIRFITQSKTNEPIQKLNFK